VSTNELEREDPHAREEGGGRLRSKVDTPKVGRSKDDRSVRQTVNVIVNFVPFSRQKVFSEYPLHLPSGIKKCFDSECLYLHLLVGVSTNELEGEDPHPREEGGGLGCRV